MGDLNVNIQNNTLTCTKWKHVIELHDVHQLIDEPTRIAAHSESLIDHLDVSIPEKSYRGFRPKGRY